MTPISHLHYADDTLLFLDEEKDYPLTIMIHSFEIVLGMKINWKKSCIVGINSNLQDYEDIAHALGCQIRKFPIDDLGGPIGGSP